MITRLTRIAHERIINRHADSDFAGTNPNDWQAYSQLGLAYLQKARETDTPPTIKELNSPR